jgi:murein DD-endopeptidase MepM/ murein hydrolase activator NlpD
MVVKSIWLLFLLLTGCASQVAKVNPALTPLPTMTPRPAITPSPADHFDYPLDPNKYGPYIYRVSGPLDVDTRYSVQNPGLGSTGKCFVDRYGQRVPFNQLYHAGEDWFAYDARRQVVPGAAKAAPVRAVANGVVSWLQDTGGEGRIVVIEHLLVDGTHVWSAYWHLASPTVAIGQVVYRGDVIGRVFDQADNSHLHWEIRTFGDGSNLFPPTSAGGRGTCNGRVTALGYTWDDVLSRASPNAWGYLDPVKFIKEHR